MVRTLAGTLALVCAASLINAGSSSAATPHPIVVAHRGGSYYPENTVAGLLSSARAGFIVETDIRWTSDDVAVLSHDPHTSRVYFCPGGDHTIAATSWATLSRCRTHRDLAPGGARTYSFPKYSTYLAQLATVAGARQWPEIKVDQTAAHDRDLITMTVDRGLLSRTTWWSFSGERVRAVGVRLGHANTSRPGSMRLGRGSPPPRREGSVCRRSGRRSLP